jgi:hypothetical protein
MSSPGSDALTLEIPSRLLADRATVGLILACAVAWEVVAARHPAGPAGIGLVAATLLSAWHWVGRRRGPALIRASLDRSDRWELTLSDGKSVPAVLRPGSRILGSSVVLRWQAGRRVRSMWLTAWDLPPEQLRELTVRLRASSAQTGA